jgi:gas vesicle protein
MNFDDRDHDSFTAFASFACGVAAGAALALFFAPASGRDTRRYVRDRSKRLADDVSQRGREVWNEKRSAVEDAFEQGRDKVTEFTNQINQAVEEGKAGYREAKERVRAAGTNVG